MRREYSKLPNALIEQWVRDAPKKTTLWSSRDFSLLPSYKLVVLLEKWIAPTWSRIKWDIRSTELVNKSAFGFITPEDGTMPYWSVLEMPEQSLDCFILGSWKVLNFQKASEH